MKFAIIGKGFIYERHKKAIEDLGHEIYLTCDIDQALQPDFIDWQEMMKSERFKEVDAVVICGPNYLHAPMARKALRLGKKVLCEKPLSINGFSGLDGVCSVLQLRYHPALQGLRASEVYVEAKMYRDENYWNGWKGNKKKSGGVLYNLGVHYIDLLIFLLGKPMEVLGAAVNDKVASGFVSFEGGGIGKFHIEIVDNRESQGRKIMVDGDEINLSNKDNLSYEDLHKKVYEEFIAGRGIGLSEAKKSINLIKKILSW